MDLEVIHRHVTGLLKFKERIEALLEGAEAGSGTAAEVLSGRIDDVRKELAELAEHVTALQVSKDEAESFSGRLGAMLDWFETNREGLEVLLSIGGDLVGKTGTIDALHGGAGGSGGSSSDAATTVPVSTFGAPGAAGTT